MKYRFIVEFDIESSSKEEAEYNIESWKRGLETCDIPMQCVGYRIAGFRILPKEEKQNG